MRQVSYLKDSSFLDKLVREKVKTTYAKVVILNQQELPITQIQGKITSGSISLQGNAAVRRTGSLSLVLNEDELDVTNINNIISMNKKIKIFVGIENNISNMYDKLIWFPLGIFVMTQPSISHGVSGVTLSLSFKDKMCLLNGECGGGLPASITFHEYDQVVGLVEADDFPLDMNDYTVYRINMKYYQWDNKKGWIDGDPSLVGTVMTRPQRIFDIIRTLVLNYGGENQAKVFINDVPLEIKSSVRYVGSGTLYYNTSNRFYTLNQRDTLKANGAFKEFHYNEDVGYVYTDFTYPGQLISGIGESVVSVLDKIKNALGNFEYFYDVEGNFVFQEIKNYLNTSYAPVEISENNSSILNSNNYRVGFNNSTKSVYTFEESSGLISSFSNSPSYLNMKNDFHIWGENDDGYVIHYHVAIKEKPTYMNTYKVRLKDGKIELANGDYGLEYTPTDWRSEMYMQGLLKRALGQRPDIYEQELLDMFDSIYSYEEKQEGNKNIVVGKYKADIVTRPNSLSYYLDFIEPTREIHDCSVDALGIRTYSYQKDNIKKLYSTDVPNNVLINVSYSPMVRNDIKSRCEAEGQPYSNVNKNIYDNIAIGVSGYSAHETARELLYQYTGYNESISIQSIPMYFLDVNSRISVFDKASNIYGDYIINSISLPLDAKGTMSISATRAMERL